MRHPTALTTARPLLAPLVFFIAVLLSAQALAFDVGGLSYSVINATDVEVTGRTTANTDKDIVIPVTVVDGSTTYSVTTIRPQAFEGDYLDSVILGNSVTTIGTRAFQFNNFDSVIIPDSVTTIGVQAFGFNYGLASVTIGSGVTTIEFLAFNRTALDSVTIPASVTAIGYRAFFNSTLTSVKFLGDFGAFDLDMFEGNTALATITYAQSTAGWPQTFAPDTGSTGSVIATPAAAAPAPPAAPTATAGDSQASVTWTRPADNGSTITGYTVTSSPGSNTCTTSGADTLTCAVAGLTNGTPYTFTVAATNGVGTSAPSPASSSVTPAALPPAPLATAVPVSPLWLLGVMVGLLSVLGIRQLCKI
ncbi:Fibronectin type III domain protein [marine gamma proteobacterium HTCC2148]|nr:Fibronectin type III domain protein [marine gamma proteobacterium HTCC2148]